MQKICKSHSFQKNCATLPIAQFFFSVSRIFLTFNIFFETIAGFNIFFQNPRKINRIWIKCVEYLLVKFWRGVDEPFPTKNILAFSEGEFALKLPKIDKGNF